MAETIFDVFRSAPAEIQSAARALITAEDEQSAAKKALDAAIDTDNEDAAWTRCDAARAATKSAAATCSALGLRGSYLTDLCRAARKGA
jgi:hypothetical protein